MGCYHDREGNHDLPDKVQGRLPAYQCVNECAQKRLKYAGVQNGGDCFCGNVSGNFGGADEFLCQQRCEGFGLQNCGGHMVNAIFMTELRKYFVTSVVI